MECSVASRNSGALKWAMQKVSKAESFAGTLHVLRIWKLALSSKRNRILGVFFTTFSGFYDE
jgi:hypothetical protein